MAKESSVNEQRASSGATDVFHDLGLPDADELLAKSNIAMAIQRTIEELAITDDRAGELMGADVAIVRDMLRGRFAELSTETMLGYLLRLGLDVDVVIHSGPSGKPRQGTLKIAYL